MITKEQILTFVQQLKDPHFKQSVTKLNLIRDIMIKEDSVSLTFVTTEEGDSYKEEMRQAVLEILQGQDVKQVHIRFRMITDHERNQIQQTMQEGDGQQEAPAQPSQPSAPSQPSSLREPLLETENVNFIAVASGKGGVGKSTVTVNLAVALARSGKKVGIVDADIYGFSVPDMMGIEEMPQLIDNRIIPIEKFGVKVISMGFFVQDNAPVIWRGPMLGKMLRNFFNEVEWGELDYMLLDLPPGTGDIALDVHQMLPHSKEIIVTTPHATAAFVAARAGAMAVHTEHEILGVVENMSYFECKSCGEKEYVFGKGGGAKLADELNSELLAQIPLGAPDNHVSEADYSPSVYKEQSATGQLYMEMADKVISKLEKL
ncbi:Mrp/NBP35 family ATP-binding protein [Paenibacillus eucommiae]|uniref:Iron-sulfur cluster carrier protein n=1 Tax=Paenibacillus eucommiae TaxID=1355755 RepID=A0ABS4J973_9BACL|nr:Mrp/NBP35 family ATP-binding protein [Paenibacillus eucommiae]MBP1996392.1 ATP-binding protein involved in chromosome partitioning [Paenibacillus eucommiae]